MIDLPPPIVVTEHAIERYCERIENLPREDVRALIMSSERVIRIASSFGARRVKIFNGARLVIDGLAVVTVLKPRFLRHER